MAAPPKSPAALGPIREEGDAPLLFPGAKSSKVAALETRPLERICRFPWLSPGKKAECWSRTISKGGMWKGGRGGAGVSVDQRYGFRSDQILVQLSRPSSATSSEENNLSLGFLTRLSVVHGAAAHSDGSSESGASRTGGVGGCSGDTTHGGCQWATASKQSCRNVQRI